MPMRESPQGWREPTFWWRNAGVEAALLSPFAAAYGAIAVRRLAQDGHRAEVPVVCIGNLTVGGAGKTPMALAAGRLLIAEGERPAFLSRGYGGSLAGPERVDATNHRASEVGDEPLLLARLAPTIVARDRVAGARMAWAGGATVIVMDDGFQNPSLVKDFSILVVDARRAIGNGRVIPAGPLRAPVDAQLTRANALVVVGGSDRANAVASAAATRKIPIFFAGLVPDAKFIAGLGKQPVLAFAGIGDPEKFYATLEEAGVNVALTRSFPDHHRFTEDDARMLCEEAERERLRLVTTDNRERSRPHAPRSCCRLARRARATIAGAACDRQRARFRDAPAPDACGRAHAAADWRLGLGPN
jgi:tetraacyldisaccharide 4'-kinase